MAKYVVNRRTGTLHKQPTREKCNMDQAHSTQRANKPDALLWRKQCGHCFK